MVIILHLSSPFYIRVDRHGSYFVVQQIVRKKICKVKGRWHCLGQEVQWKLDLADTDLAENLDLKDTLQKI